MRSLASALACLTACAAAPQFVARATLVPHKYEAKMLDDARDNRQFDAVAKESAAMLIGGPAEPGDVAQAILLMRSKLAPVIAAAKRVDEAQRPRKLLELLYEDFGAGGPVLVKYVKRSATLYDAIATGRYNCVSSAIVYALAAAELGIDARPYVTDEHARITVHQGDERYVVETTIRGGFDPPIAGQSVVRRLVRGRDVIDAMDPRGEEVDFAGLLAFVYVSMAATFIDQNDLPLSQAMLERAEALIPEETKRYVREQLALSLTALALDDGRTSEDAIALTLKAYPFAQTASTKHSVAATVAYLADRLTKRAAPTEGEIGEWRSLLEPLGDDKHQALAILEVAAGDHEAARATIDRALALCSGDACDALRELDVYRLSTIKDGVRAAEGFQQRYSLAKLPKGDTVRDNTAAIADHQLYTLNKAGRCTEIAAAAKAWGTLVDKAYVREVTEGCFAHRGYELLMKNDHAKAAIELRAALKQFEKSKDIKNNLVVAVSRQAQALVERKKCKDALPLLEEGRRLEPSDKWFKDTIGWCKKNGG